MANHTGQSQQSPPQSPLPPASVCGIILKRPGDSGYGTLTLILSSAAGTHTRDFYMRDLSAKTYRAIFESLDSIINALLEESATMNLTVELRVPGFPVATLNREKPDSTTSIG